MFDFCWEKSIIGTNLWSTQIILTFDNSWIFDSGFKNKGNESSTQIKNNHFFWSFGKRNWFGVGYGNTLWCANKWNFMA